MAPVNESRLPIFSVRGFSMGVVQMHKGWLYRKRCWIGNLTQQVWYLEARVMRNMLASIKLRVSVGL